MRCQHEAAIPHAASLCNVTPLPILHAVYTPSELSPPVMKALFQRLQRSVGVTKDRDEKAPAAAPPTPSKEKRLDLSLGPLPVWPPPDSATNKPLPTPESRAAPPLDQTEVVPMAASNSDGQSSSNHDRPQRSDIATPTPPAPARSNSNRRTADGSIAASDSHSRKVVAFISPAPTPGPGMTSTSPPTNSASPPFKSTVTRFQATHGRASGNGPSSSRTDVNSTQSRATGTTRGTLTPTPHPQKSTDSSSYRSATPYSQMSNNSSRILAAASWSEGAEDDLVSHIGPRERTRQEVLWEIVASEERSVFPSSVYELG